MLSKKFYFPIGVLILVICAVCFLSLRSDVPTEPIKIYKAVESQAKPKAETPVAKSQDGHFHADGTFHADPHTSQLENKSSSENQLRVEVNAPTGLLLGNGKMITDPDEIARHIEKEDRLLESALKSLDEQDAYAVRYARYSKALKSHEMETERLYANYESIQKRFDDLVFNYDTKKFSEYFTGLTREKQLELTAEMKSIHAEAQHAAEVYKTFRSQAPPKPEKPVSLTQ